MFGLVGLIWLAASGGLAYGFAKMFTYYHKEMLVRLLLVVIFWPVIFLMPLADEIIGKRQFDKLCEEANEVKIYGTIPVGEELYTPDGKWRLDLPNPDLELKSIADSYITVEYGKLRRVGSVIFSIYERNVKITEKNNERLLAEWRTYQTQGGWLSSQLESPFIVQSECKPNLIKRWGISKALLKFQPERNKF
ncbi:MAG: hypothetical protein Q4G70_12710 [Pseudomonadota bacterium]|nr:hypothetical protein [Pseudomonadota bacterium]